MADTILSGRWIIHYDADNRQKRLERDTSITPTTIDTVNQLYSALQNQFDELPQMDDGVPMSAQTPTEYTIGIIDAGDKDPWFIDRTSVEYLQGGAIKTASWKRNPLVGDGTGTTGIIRIKYTATTNLDPTDIGRDILISTGSAHRGTILDFNDTDAASKLMWIRPDSNAAINSFNNSTDGSAFTIPDDSLGQVWNVVASGPTYADETTDANEGTANDWNIFPAGTNTEANYALIGYRQKFKKFIMNVGTAGLGTYTVPAANWQYWNGAWTALSGVSDGTTGFKTAGTNNVTFTVPTDWVSTSINGSASLYYIRAVKDTGTITTAPLGTQGFIGSTGATLAQVNIAGGGSAATGESLWANIYNTGLANIEKFTHQYVYQAGANLKKYKSTTADWWGDQTTGEADDQIDILINIKELDVEVDEGYVTVLARQYSKTYDNFIVDLTAGGRNPIPLATGADLNNTTGYQQFTSTSGVGTFSVGNFIYAPAAGGWTAATKRGVITKVVGSPGTTPTLDYYLLGDLTNFVNTDTVKEYTGTADGDASCTSAAPTDVGPATFTTITAVHANNSTFDIDEVSPNENYSIVVDLGAPTYTVAQGYEWSKYITRRGGTTIGNTDDIGGERYIGSDYRIIYTTLTGTISEGGTVTQVTTLATGTVVAHNTTAKILILRNSRGTFNNTNEIRVVVGVDANKVTGITATSLAPIKAAPFGTFAGGTWFGAPGVVFKDTLAADANKYQLTDDNGNVVKAPTKVTISVGNTIANDKVAVFRLTAALGTIKKDRYNATAQAAGVTTAIMGANIAVDEPGKTVGGVIRLVDVSASTEYRIRFGSWSLATFKLYGHADHGNTTGLTADASGCTATQITDTGQSFTTTVKVGDIIRNITESKIAYVTTVTSNTVLQTTAVTDWTSDSFEINTLPVATTTTPQDTVYVPLIDSFETTGTSGTPGTEEAVVTFSANIPVRVRARRTNATAILPYEADSTVTSAGMSNNIIRTADTIFT